MENLPDDILSNIFVRLRAKQLAQMRCISKPWNSLLSQSSFVKSHLARSVHNNDGILFVFADSFRFDSQHLTVYPSRSPHMELTNFIKLPFHTQPNHGRGAVIGSVNGLICFSYGSSDSKFEGIYIWNPSLSKVLTLPPYSKSSHFDNWITANVFRFGFDSQSDDYKVVNFTEGVDLTPKGKNRYSNYRKCLQMEVYSMRKGSWKLITQKIPSRLTWMYDHAQMCLDGHHPNLHWLGKTDFGRIEMIVGFDLGAETFREMPLPDSIRVQDAISNYLGVLGGKLCVMSPVPGGECEVWVMEEYGVPELWNKLHVFPWFGYGLKPFGFTLHNEFIFGAKSHGLALYDPIKAKAKSFKFRDDFNHRGCKVVEYVDSLVWVTPPKQCNSLISLLNGFCMLFGVGFWFCSRRRNQRPAKLN